MALVVGNTASGSFTTAANPTIAITNNANGVSTLLITYYSNGAFAKTTAISDPSGDTWNCRKRTFFQSAYAGAGSTANASFITTELWWSNEVATHNRSLTLTVLNHASVVQAQWMFACITGSTTPAAPFDTDASLPAMQTFGSASATAAITQNITTSQANSLILAMVSEETSTLSGATLASTGTGMTAVDNQQDGTTPNFFHIFQEKKAQATAGAVTVACTTTKQSFTFLVDALSGTSTGSSTSFSGDVSGTATTNLTKASQSLSGSQTITSGTINTNLTKASLAATAAEKFTGTIATNLTKPSLAGAGAVASCVGTITTHLTKLNQSASAAEKFTGTVATQLTRISQVAAAADLSLTGTMTTNLSGIRQTVATQEIITGTAETALDGGFVAFHLVAQAFEVFRGTITTQLGPVQQSLVGEEDIIGHVVTRLGPSSGSLVGTEIQALEIIEGPIITSLNGFSQSILAGQLGTAGAGKWYSYRYLDS